MTWRWYVLWFALCVGIGFFLERISDLEEGNDGAKIIATAIGIVGPLLHHMFKKLSENE